ncbi:TPA: hypothetical protein ACK02A_002817 [Staphylococcus aureus]
MYNTLTVKCDLLEIGNRRLIKPKHIQTFRGKGYNIYESYRIFDNGHELNVMLGVKHGQKYLIVSDIQNKLYQVEKFNGKSLSCVIRYLNKDGLNKLTSALKDGSIKEINIVEYFKNTDFKNRLEICVNELRLIPMLLGATLITAWLTLTTTLL